MTARTVFHLQADAVTKLVAQERLDEVDATFLLSVLIDHLPWSNEAEILAEAEEFRKLDFVANAFRAQGYSI